MHEKRTSQTIANFDQKLGFSSCCGFDGQSGGLQLFGICSDMQKVSLAWTSGDLP